MRPSIVIAFFAAGLLAGIIGSTLASDPGNRQISAAGEGAWILGDHHHGRVRQRVAGHRQQFERVVEGGGVALVFEADRVELAQVFAEHR